MSPLGVARIYRDFVGTFIIDKRDEGFIEEIERLGVEVFTAKLLMSDISSRVEPAKTVLSIAGTKSSRS